MTFVAYLHDKRISSEAFRKAEPELWEEWKQLFVQLSPNSFTAQKLYLINPIRRKYTAIAGESAEEPIPGAKS